MRAGAATVDHPDHEARLSGVADLGGFRTDVQALRGVAVLLVVLFHAQLWVPGGFVGVDVFFVISGFVIGRRLLARMADPSPERGTLRRFYVHRVRRILPPLALLLVSVALLSPLFAPIGGLEDVRPTTVAAALFSANAYLYHASAVGYFDASSTLNPLLHTWSLSIEEQFYFVFPILLVVAWAVGLAAGSGLRALRILTGVTIGVSLGLCVAWSYADRLPRNLDGERLAFYSPMTRAWEFAVGLALVLLPTWALAGRAVRRVARGVGAALIGVAAFTYSDAMVFPGIAVVVPVLGAALVIYGGTGASPIEPSRRRSPAVRPLSWAGDVSYSWYLWHWPVIVFAAALWPRNRGVLVVAAAASLLPAWLSYRWVERGFRSPSTPRAGPAVGLALACIAAPLGAIVVAGPITRAVDRAVAEHARISEPDSGQRVGAMCNSLVPRGQRSDECIWGDVDAPQRVVLLGDSYAAQLSDPVIESGIANGARVEVVTRAGCPLTNQPYVWRAGEDKVDSPEQCARFIADSIRALEADPPDVVVLAEAMSNWVFSAGALAIDPDTGTVPRREDDRVRLAVDSRADLVGRLQAAGSRVVIADAGPTPFGYGTSFDVRECSKALLLVDVSRCLGPDFTVEAATGPGTARGAAVAARERIARRTGATLWQFTEQVCPDGVCKPLRDGQLVWRDPGHISGSTAGRLALPMNAYLRIELGANGRGARTTGGVGVAAPRTVEEDGWRTSSPSSG